MTRGEKIAWIWVWSAMALLSVAVVSATWRYGNLPFAYLESFLCSGPNGPVATSACERIAFNDQLPAGLRSTALRKLIDTSAQEPKIQVERLTLLIELGTANAEDWNSRGLSYYSLRDYENAAKDFEQAARMNGVVGVYWSNLGAAQTENRKYKEAFDNYTTAMRNGDDTAEVRGNRGWASYQLGNYEKALADYDQAIAQNPQHADNLNERGLVRHALGKYEDALADYDRSLAVTPDNPVILTNRAITHARIGNAEKTRQDLDRAIALNPDYAPARLEKAWLWINQFEPEKAKPELEELERIAPLDISGLEARSHARIDLAEWPGAIADADKALAMGSPDDWPYEHRARAKRGLGDYEGAVEDATILVTRAPKKIDRLVARAIPLHLGGHTDAALAEMNQAIARNIDPAYAYEIKSYLNLGSGRVKEAVSDARQSLALASGAQSQHSSAILGWALLEDQQPALAIDACSKSLAANASSGAYSCRALAYLALHRVDAALAEARLALAADRLSSSGHFALGRIDLAQGRAAEAVKRFDLALKFDVFGKSEILMYRGDAEAALDNIDKARTDYQMARKLDRGLRRQVIDERLAKLPSQ